MKIQSNGQTLVNTINNDVRLSDNEVWEIIKAITYDERSNNYRKISEDELLNELEENYSDKGEPRIILECIKRFPRMQPSVLDEKCFWYYIPEQKKEYSD